MKNSTENIGFIQSIKWYEKLYATISVVEIILIILLSFIGPIWNTEIIEYITVLAMLILSISASAAITFLRHSKIDYTNYEDEEVKHRILVEVSLKSIIVLLSIIFVKIMLL